jgi:hypothetical protein
MDGQHELIKEMADSSESVHSGTELEQTADIADSAPKGRAAPEAVLESSSQMQLDTRNFPGNIETNDPQHEPHGSPDVNSGNQAGERMNSENYGRSSGEVMNNDLEPGTSAVDEQEVVQPHDHDVGEKDGGGQEDDGDKGEHVVQMDQTEDEGGNDARYPAGANDGGAEGFEIRVVKQKLKQDEEELQQSDRQESRLSSSATSDGDITETYENSASEELGDSQGHMNRPGTPAVTISSSDIPSTQSKKWDTRPSLAKSPQKIALSLTQILPKSNVNTRTLPPNEKLTPPELSPTKFMGSMVRTRSSGPMFCKAVQ